MSRKNNVQRSVRSLKDLDFHRPELALADETKRWIGIIITFTLSVLSFLSLVNAAGTFGQYFGGALTSIFGLTRWFFPIGLLGLGYMLLRPSKFELRFSSYLGMSLLALGGTGVIHLTLATPDVLAAAKAGQAGGWLGVILAWPLLQLMGFWASLVVLVAITCVGLLLVLNTAIDGKSEAAAESFRFWERMRSRATERKIRKFQDSKEQQTRRGVVGPVPEVDADPAQALGFQKRSVETPKGEAKAEMAASVPEGSNKPVAGDVELTKGVMKFSQTKVDLPLDLLDGKVGTPNGGDLKTNKIIIEKTLEQFGIQVEMGDAQVGPTVTQYTFKPAAGVKLSRISALQDNLALALAAHPIRIEAPIPGRSLVGLEVPNQSSAIVPLRQALTSEQFQHRNSNMLIALGVDVMGKPWFADLPKLPHLLIAGATGSGKSVSINTLILSLLFQNGPGSLKFIMVDPKRVELPIYNGIPHLITPVITDVKKTVNALRWSIGEMERRFEVLSQAHKRNIESYNAESSEPLPYIVIVIDELADLMAAAAAEVEGAIIRLAQMSRAVGIHLVLATQRPSVDVITGLIKANITSRVAFSVASLVDSRTILDTSGAEKLLGRGDMLFISAELGKPKRLQGAYASDAEIKRVIDALRSQAEPEYVDAVIERSNPTGLPSGGGDGEDLESDPLLEEAKAVIIQARKASASLLQRRLRVGYARAARLLDLLEAQGIIGPGDGAKPRDILIGGGSAGSPADDDVIDPEAGMPDDADSLDEDEPEEEISDADDFPSSVDEEQQR